MLHNSGSFGPGETPISAALPVNMSNMSTPLNISHSLGNLAKIAQQGPQMQSGHYNPTDYSNYNHSPLNMSPQISNFGNFHPLNFQPSYINESHSTVHDSPWQNGMLPMNLHTSTSHSQNLISDRTFPEKKSPVPIVNHTSKEESQNPRIMPINIPQVPFNTFQNDESNESFSLFNVNRDRFNNFNQTYNLNSKVNEKIILDNTRRKSLENTVRLIEDILINTTKNKESQLNNRTAKKTKESKRDSDQSEKQVSNEMEKPTDLQVRTKETETEMTEADDQAEESDDNKESSEDNDNNDSEEESDDTAVSETKESPEINPLELTNKVKEEEIDTDLHIPHVDIKVEPLCWTDMETVHIFQRDLNATPREKATDSRIISIDDSVIEAMAAMKNDVKSSCYYECPYCDLLFHNPKRFLIHTKWHMFGQPDTQRSEIIKDKDMRNRKEEEDEEGEKNSKAGKKRPIYICNEKDCDKSFYSKGSLKNHRQRYHPTRIRECKQCGATLVGWMALRAHMATHATHASPGFQCPDCPKQFKYKHSLNKHRDTHLEKTVSCSQCDKMFGTEAQLKMHQRVHERYERGPTHHCSYCGKGFYENYNLTVHERTHRNERPFLCDICNTSFGTNSSLKRHMRVSHNTAKPFECGTCHRSFVSANIRDRHAARLHGDSALFAFPCTQCDCKYMKQKDLRQHTNKAHPKKAKRRSRKEDSDSE